MCTELLFVILSGILVMATEDANGSSDGFSRRFFINVELQEDILRGNEHDNHLASIDSVEYSGPRKHYPSL